MNFLFSRIFCFHDFFLIFSSANRSDDQKPTLMKENDVACDADKLNDPSKAEELLADMDPDAIVGDEDEIGMIVNFNNESLKLKNYDGIGRKHRGRALDNIDIRHFIRIDFLVNCKLKKPIFLKIH